MKNIVEKFTSSFQDFKVCIETNAHNGRDFKRVIYLYNNEFQRDHQKKKLQECLQQFLIQHGISFKFKKQYTELLKQIVDSLEIVETPCFI